MKKILLATCFFILINFADAQVKGILERAKQKVGIKTGSKSITLVQNQNAVGVDITISSPSVTCTNPVSAYTKFQAEKYLPGSPGLNMYTGPETLTKATITLFNSGIFPLSACK